MDRLREILETREDMINDPRGINMDVFKTLGFQLSNDTSNVENLLRDIEDSLAQIKTNPEQFQITESELASREKFVNQTNKELADISERAKNQSLNHKITFSLPTPSPSEAPTRSSGQQSQMLEHREEQLNMIEETVAMQLSFAREIDNELADQQQVLLSLGDNIDNASEAMKNVTAQIKRLIENEGKVPTMLVIILSITLIILLFFAA